MAFRKNKRFIDPRYFMDEKMDEIDEQPKQKISPPAAEEKKKKWAKKAAADIEKKGTED